MSFTLNNAPNQTGKIAIVTGANTGLGYKTTLGLAQNDAQVIMACRNLKKAEAAKVEILKEIPTANLVIMHLDLNSLQSVRDFSAAFIEKYNRLDLLIENAGIMMPPFSKTKDGFESQMGVNYFSHFLLTNLLFPLLNKTEHSRIITLSSKAHESGKIDFENLNAEKGYSKWSAYGQSKLACLMFAYELDRRIKASESNVIAVAAHPGGSNTNLGQHIPKVLYALLLPILSIFIHSPKKAALPTLMAALDPNVKGGEFYGPTGFNEFKGKPGLVTSKPHSYNEKVAERLWNVSEELTGKKFNI